jgi:POT family proton-dependent oligopeptide transporter
LLFYLAINIGGFFSLATTYSERFVGFWLAYLLPGIVYMLVPFVLYFVRPKLYLAPAQGSVVLEAWRVVKTAFARGGIRGWWKGGDTFWNAAKPSVMEARDGVIDRSVVQWDDLFVDEIRQSISACSVFLLIPIFNLADNGFGTLMNSMSAAMQLDNVPNDL